MEKAAALLLFFSRGRKCFPLVLSVCSHGAVTVLSALFVPVVTVFAPRSAILAASQPGISGHPMVRGRASIRGRAKARQRTRPRTIWFVLQ